MNSGARSSLTDLDLLEVQDEASMDDRHRLVGVWGVALAATGDGHRLTIGAEVSDALVPALVRAFETSAHVPAPDIEPPAIAVCRTILAPCCSPLDLHTVPYYLFELSVPINVTTPIVRSDQPLDERLRRLNPGNWEADEWDDLLDGALGPWAMALLDGRIVSICHTPRPMTERTAECGVWTHPDYRGRGLATEVAAAWADVLHATGRFLFYAHDARNAASQRVAARLGLRPIGRIWRLETVHRGVNDRRHPLSRRRPSGDDAR